jgi:osmoprotectant transport system ATP-binding protein
MIEIKDVYKSYGNQPVLTGFDLIIEEGQLCMLLGPSGCGKSTLLKLINRLLTPDAGSILVNGKSVEDVQPERLRRSMGYAIQGAALFPHMRVDENIAVVPRLMNWSKEVTATRVQELLELVGLPASFAKKYPYQLSGGEAQRVGVARALAADPPILLLDEPFGALDPVNRLQLQMSFLEIQAELNKTVVFVTHDVGEAVRMADFLVLMKDGKAIAKGHPFDIVRQAENTIRDFLGNSYSLELLDRITMRDLAKTAMPVQVDALSPGQMTISPDGTCKELLSYMLMDGKSEMVAQMEGQMLRFRFEDILASFRGGNR